MLSAREVRFLQEIDGTGENSDMLFSPKQSAAFLYYRFLYIPRGMLYDSTESGAWTQSEGRNLE